MRICSICKIEKEDNLFYKDSRRKNWLRSICKECSLERYPYKHSQKKRDTWIKYSRTLKWRITLLLKWTRDRSKKHNLPFDLDIEWVESKLVKWTCELTWLEFRTEIEKEHRANPFWASIDKIDPKKWYVKSNCRMICFCINMARCDWWDSVLMEMSKAIVKWITLPY